MSDETETLKGNDVPPTESIAPDNDAASKRAASRKTFDKVKKPGGGTFRSEAHRRFFEQAGEI